MSWTQLILFICIRAPNIKPNESQNERMQLLNARTLCSCVCRLSIARLSMNNWIVSNRDSETKKPPHKFDCIRIEQQRRRIRDYNTILFASIANICAEIIVIRTCKWIWAHRSQTTHTHEPRLCALCMGRWWWDAILRHVNKFITRRPSSGKVYRSTINKCARCADAKLSYP